MNLLVNIARGERKRQIPFLRARRFFQGKLWKAAGILALAAGIPCGSWLMGSGVAWVAPHTYRSTAIVHLPSSFDRSAVEQERQRMSSNEVVKLATRSLANQAGSRELDSMDAYVLWSSVETENMEGANSVKLAVRGSDAASTQRKLEAVVNAYQSMTAPAAASGQNDATMIPIACVMPTESLQVRVPDDIRMILGMAGFAGVALLLSIPLLKQMESFENRGVTA
ncbi:MAG: hypothetical protein JWO82_1481 [Akkermansiaceae bacterium]|nr:hypothetical protein [Akkermansiaceae bacterium]